MERELLLEIGTEELPASWLPDLGRQIRVGLDAALKAHRLLPDAPVESYSTPRRLTACVAKIAERQTDLDELVTGPPVAAAFGLDGQPTQAALGFARKNGIDVSQLEKVETPKGVYLGHRKHVRGKAANSSRGMSTCPNTYFDCSISSRRRTSLYLTPPPHSMSKMLSTFCRIIAIRSRP